MAGLYSYPSWLKAIKINLSMTTCKLQKSKFTLSWGLIKPYLYGSKLLSQVPLKMKREYVATIKHSGSFEVRKNIFYKLSSFAGIICIHIYHDNATFTRRTSWYVAISLNVYANLVISGPKNGSKIVSCIHNIFIKLTVRSKDHVNSKVMYLYVIIFIISNSSPYYG